MSDHGSVQPILRHNAALAPRLLRLAPLGTPVLEPNLLRAKTEIGHVSILFHLIVMDWQSSCNNPLLS